MTLSARTIRREAKHDIILREALMKRLIEIHPLQNRADMKVFEADSTQALRERVSAFEQEIAQKIMREKRAPGSKQAMAQALMRLAQLAGQPLQRHYLAERGEAGFNAKGVVHPGAEAREDALAIISAGLATQKKDGHTLPIVTDRVQDADYKYRHHEKYWLVTPMDGREHKDVSISIALIEKGKPLMGIVHFPRLNRTYAGIPSEQWVIAQTGKVTRKIKSKARDQFKRVAAAPHGARKDDAFRAFKNNHDVKRVFGESSAAYGLVRLAQGSFDLYLHHTTLPQASLAAAHAIAVAAGGVVLRDDGKPLIYTPSGHLPAVPPFVAASAEGILKHKDNKRLVA